MDHDLEGKEVLPDSFKGFKKKTRLFLLELFFSQMAKKIIQELRNIVPAKLIFLTSSHRRESN